MTRLHDIMIKTVRWAGRWARFCTLLCACMVVQGVEMPVGAQPRSTSIVANQYAIKAASDLAAANYILPAFTDFEDAAAEMPERVQRMCTTGDDGAREELNSGFRDLVGAWNAISIVRIPPLETNNRRARITQPWRADPAVRRVIQSTLAAQNSTHLELSAFEKVAPAAQGLAAFEALLSGDPLPLGPGDASTFSCAYAATIANQMKNTAIAMRSEVNRQSPMPTSTDLIQALADAVSMLRIEHQRLARTGVVMPAFVSPSQARNDYVTRVAALERLYDALELEAMLPESKDWVKTSANRAWRVLRGTDGAGGRADGSTKRAAPSFDDVTQAWITLDGLLRREIGIEFGMAQPAPNRSRR